MGVSAGRRAARFVPPFCPSFAPLLPPFCPSFAPCVFGLSVLSFVCWWGWFRGLAACSPSGLVVCCVRFCCFGSSLGSCSVCPRRWAVVLVCSPLCSVRVGLGCCAFRSSVPCSCCCCWSRRCWCFLRGPAVAGWGWGWAVRFCPRRAAGVFALGCCPRFSCCSVACWFPAASVFCSPASVRSCSCSAALFCSLSRSRSVALAALLGCWLVGPLLALWPFLCRLCRLPSAVLRLGWLPSSRRCSLRLVAPRVASLAPVFCWAVGGPAASWWCAVFPASCPCFASVGFAGSRALSGPVLGSVVGLAVAASACGSSVLVASAAGGVSAAVGSAVPSAVVFSPPAGLVGGAALAARASAFVRALAVAPSPLLVCAPAVACPAGVLPRRSWFSCGSGSWSELALAVGLACSVFVVGLPASALPSSWAGSWAAGSLGGVSGFFFLRPSPRQSPLL